MKNKNKSSRTERNFSTLVAGLRKHQILDTARMIHVRGGEGEGSGYEPIIIIPPKKKDPERPS
ncbi:MAG TPA: hypothetical protein PLO24_00655 [Bacteroidales bacterium]|jgi:predicted RNA binding protein with dsRBD fold (UPF0201 family)|nr:hypothetical protein [Bacteroidales bacterium]HOS72341.1 hypothetical protein [Bacteroidales bacterium]HQH25023.1 hypothetical protein [Bacteroidales bacterium]HQJ82453.1 hypothetical protein [Bacteroidales bacterium]